MKKENIESVRLLDACQRISQIDENYITSIDYILASSEFEEFYEMMIDYKVRDFFSEIFIFKNIFSYQFDENSDLSKIINK